MSSRSATGYHLETTGQAAKTVAEHAVDKVTDPSIEFMGACFCPFVQRAWIALEVLNQGLPDDQSRRASKVDYAYVEIDPYKKPKELLEVSPKGLVPVSYIPSICSQVRSAELSWDHRRLDWVRAGHYTTASFSCTTSHPYLFLLAKPRYYLRTLTSAQGYFWLGRDMPRRLLQLSTDTFRLKKQRSR